MATTKTSAPVNGRIVGAMPKRAKANPASEHAAAKLASKVAVIKAKSKKALSA